MGFAGVKNPTERANLIAYLRTLADTPAPLPEAPAPSRRTGLGSCRGCSPARRAGGSCPCRTRSGSGGARSRARSMTKM